MEAMEGRHALIVMRHAKAGELPGGPDAERALTERGRRDAAAAGQWLRDSGYLPDAVICSSARRTRQTWQQVSAELGRTVECASQDSLYLAEADALLAEIGLTPEPVLTLLYVGHNPAAGQFAAELTGAEVNFPTAAVAVIGLAGSWANLAPGTGDLIASWTPRGEP
ncbi:MAG TPA: histidine phosphatase family protein [Streptosporangiaceae bacterium]|jgi:phosphohistidine phosphatase